MTRTRLNDILLKKVMTDISVRFVLHPIPYLRMKWATVFPTDHMQRMFLADVCELDCPLDDEPSAPSSPLARLNVQQRLAVNRALSKLHRPLPQVRPWRPAAP